MITEKIKNLFQFIEFLHSNIDNFKQYDKTIEELQILKIEKSKLKPRNNFKDKLRHDELKTEIKSKFKVIQENIIKPINKKAVELIDYTETNEISYHWDATLETEIFDMKKNFSNDDLPEIFDYKRKYIKYRTETKGESFFGLGVLFSELDQLLKELFNFFNESNKNEFEAFENKPIKVNSYTELAEIISGKNKLNIEIDKNLSIYEKLDCWKSIIDKHFNEPLTKQFGEYESTPEQEQAKKKLLIKLFGTNYRLISPLLIPEHIYNEHFENGLNEPEFTYWFLKYNAHSWFEVEIKRKRLNEKLKTPLAENFIKAELKKLNDCEQKAEDLLNKEVIDIYKEYSYSEYAKEIEYLRIKAGHYKTRSLPDVHTTGNTTVVTYAEHVYLKNFLESELNKYITTPTGKPQQESSKPETIEFNALIGSQNLLIPKLPIKEVYEHFKILTEQTNKFNEFYLTKEQLFIFIKSTFIDKKPVKQKFKTFRNKDIRKIFYQFYFISKKHEGNQTRIKRKYFNILNDAFEGFNENDYNDFHKI